MNKRRVVVTGMGVVSCFGSELSKFYQSLLNADEAVRKINFFDEEFTTRFGVPVQDFDALKYLSKKEARRADLAMAFAVNAGMDAIANAKLCKDSVDKSRAGVIMGSGMGGMQSFVNGVQAMTLKGYKRVSPFFVPHIITNMPGAMLSMNLGFTGPSYSISTACATANYSMLAAYNHIANGECDLMVAGGVEAGFNEMCFAGFASIRALSRRNDTMQTASRPWDKTRDGFVLGEGCGALVLESLEHALARGAPILCEFNGGAFTNDAYHMTETMPDGQQVAACIKKALENTAINPERINFINAHATSTPVGDLCEIRAIKSVFGDLVGKIKMNATKSIIGHALGASSALEMVGVILAIQYGKIHPTKNSIEIEEELNGFDLVQGKAQEHKIDVALKNSFGFGGHNSCVLVSRYN
jgi:3-oxoacyl-[acyl-carrier-protein] synthase II